MEDVVEEGRNAPKSVVKCGGVIRNTVRIDEGYAALSGSVILGTRSIEVDGRLRMSKLMLFPVVAWCFYSNL